MFVLTFPNIAPPYLTRTSAHGNSCSQSAMFAIYDHFWKTNPDVFPFPFLHIFVISKFPVGVHCTGEWLLPNSVININYGNSYSYMHSYGVIWFYKKKKGNSEICVLLRVNVCKKYRNKHEWAFYFTGRRGRR